MGRTLSTSTSTPIAAHAAIHRARSSGKAAPELKTAPPAGNPDGARAVLLRREPPERSQTPPESAARPGRVPPPVPINTKAPAQPEIRTERGLFCCAGNRRRGSQTPPESAAQSGRVPPVTPINTTAPARPEIRSGQGLWRLGYAVGAEVPASVSRTSTRRVISRLQVKRVISQSPASRAAGSSASISVIPVT